MAGHDGSSSAIERKRAHAAKQRKAIVDDLIGVVVPVSAGELPSDSAILAEVKGFLLGCVRGNDVDLKHRIRASWHLCQIAKSGDADEDRISDMKLRQIVSEAERVLAHNGGLQ